MKIPLKTPIYKLQQRKDAFAGEEVDTSVFFSNALLIEDDPAHALLIKRALSGIIGEVQHSVSGAEALRLVEKEFVEIVFCDLNLPDMSGIAVIKEIRSIRPGLPVIMLTSSNNLADAVHAMQEGAWDYMVKQFNEELHNQMKLVVTRAVERKLQQVREVRMRQERDAFWTAASAAQDGLAILTEEGMLVFGNEAFKSFCKIMGGGRGEINVAELLGHHNQAIAKAFSSQLKQQDAHSLWTSEVELIPSDRKDSDSARNNENDRSLFFELKLSNILANVTLSEGSPFELPQLCYHILWVRDITGRKEQEKFQRDLLSTTTHDLKGPLSAILTSAELIEDSAGALGGKEKDLLNKVGSCARSAISIIDEFLSARRIQDGVMVIRPSNQDLCLLLEDVVGDFQPIAKSKAINLTFRTAEQGLQVFADRLGLFRVLGNLVNNALKFTPREGKVEVYGERAGTEVRISVTDTGCGIDSKAAFRLFRRYSRLEKHQEVEGTGLGLFVAKNIIEAHNGRIELRSQVGSGSTFIITLPDGPEESL